MKRADIVKTSVIAGLVGFASINYSTEIGHFFKSTKDNIVQKASQYCGEARRQIHGTAYRR